jgi:hypothetical protein
MQALRSSRLYRTLQQRVGWRKYNSFQQPPNFDPNRPPYFPPHMQSPQGGPYSPYPQHPNMYPPYQGPPPHLPPHAYANPNIHPFDLPPPPPEQDTGSYKEEKRQQEEYEKAFSPPKLFFIVLGGILAFEVVNGYCKPHHDNLFIYFNSILPVQRSCR